MSKLQIFFGNKASEGNTLVKLSTHDPKFEGLSLAADCTKKEK